MEEALGPRDAPAQGEESRPSHDGAAAPLLPEPPPKFVPFDADELEETLAAHTPAGPEAPTEVPAEDPADGRTRGDSSIGEREPHEPQHDDDDAEMNIDLVMDAQGKAKKKRKSKTATSSTSTSSTGSRGALANWKARRPSSGGGDASHLGLAPVPDDGSQGEVHEEHPKRETPLPKRVENGKDEVLDKYLAQWAKDIGREIAEHDGAICNLISDIGGCSSTYRRARNEELGRVLSVSEVPNRIVAEIYSPERVTDAARLLPQLQAIPGFAMDLTNGWDFNIAEHRAAAKKKIEEVKPQLLIGSPMCTAYSGWQHINDRKRDADLVAWEKERARMHLSFCAELYTMQAAAGRYFLHEHPASASSWCEEVIQKVLRLSGVGTIVCDQCQYNGDDGKGNPLRKPTKWMSNAPLLLRALGKRCQGVGGTCSRARGGRHALCSGMVARRAATYPFRLCRAILEGFRQQLLTDGILREGMVGMQYVSSEEIDDRRAQRAATQVLSISRECTKYFDDLTNQPLREDLVQHAIAKELEYFEQKGVWRLVPAEEAKRVTGKPAITVRWVHTNKGDDDNPNVRSRLVARQIRGAGQEAIFAPTPPLEGLRTVLSVAATRLPGQPAPDRDPRSNKRIQISLIDISRAYFNAVVDEENPTYVQLPPEHPQGNSGMCARLIKHMYGTRHAAEGWQNEYSGTLVGLGFVQGLASPCMFHHPERGLVTSVHGDDFTTAGPKDSLDWFETELAAKYELSKGGRLGPAPEDDKQGLVLNRVIRWTENGIEYEADPRQAEKLLEETGLGDATTNTCATPGVKPLPETVAADQPLPEGQHTTFRGTSARGNYLAAGRPDCQFAAKEVCRWMSAPSKLSMEQLKRMVRYLNGRRRLVFCYPFQEAERLECYSDTDWSGCVRTRKSTSGGCLMLGRHVLKTWSSTQPTVSLSSGEAEYYGVVRAAGLALGQQSLLRDLGHDLPVRVWTDSSAAIGISSRQGLGKLRHIATHTLWVQQAVRTRAMELRKVRGDVNPADLFTKHLSSRDRVTKLTELFGCEFRDGRPANAPQLRKSKSGVNAVVGGGGVRPGHGHEGHTHAHTHEHAHAHEDQPPLLPHDTTLLPHEHPTDALDALFPRAEAEAEPADFEPGVNWEQYACPVSLANCEHFRRFRALAPSASARKPRPWAASP